MYKSKVMCYNIHIKKEYENIGRNRKSQMILLDKIQIIFV